MWGGVPDLFDPSQAPPAATRRSCGRSCPTAQRRSANWDRARDAHGATCCALAATAPNLADAVIGSFTRSPLDVERELPNMREGDLLVGAFTNGPDRLRPAVSTRAGTLPHPPAGAL
jgi:phytoene dehydrogenase-like protein